MIRTLLKKDAICGVAIFEMSCSLFSIRLGAIETQYVDKTGCAGGKRWSFHHRWPGMCCRGRRFGNPEEKVLQNGTVVLPSVR